MIEHEEREWTVNGCSLLALQAYHYHFTLLLAHGTLSRWFHVSYQRRRTSDDHFFRDSLIHFLSRVAIRSVMSRLLPAGSCLHAGWKRGTTRRFSALVQIGSLLYQRAKAETLNPFSNGVRKAEVKVDENLLWNIKSITATFIHHSNGLRLPFWDADC